MISIICQLAGLASVRERCEDRRQVKVGYRPGEKGTTDVNGE
jgi:hypothetical protein